MCWLNIEAWSQCQCCTLESLALDNSTAFCIINEASTTRTSLPSVVWPGEENCFATGKSTFFWDRFRMFTEPVDKPASGYTNVQQSSTCCTSTICRNVNEGTSRSGVLIWKVGLGTHFALVSLIVHLAQIFCKFTSACMHVHVHWYACLTVQNKYWGQNLFVTWLL